MQLELQSILNDIKVPSFYHDIAELEGVELIQGTFATDRPHYEKKEQIICAVDGSLQFQLVPHVNRQEVYNGKDIINSPYNQG